MEKISTLYFNDMVYSEDNVCEILEEFKAYITSQFYSLVVLFDGLNIHSKPITEDKYNWKLTVNECVELHATMKTSKHTPNIILIEVDWEILCKPDVVEKHTNMAEYMCVIISRECQNLHAFFEFRKHFSGR
jgi:hypothetical protein